MSERNRLYRNDFEPTADERRAVEANKPQRIKMSLARVGCLVECEAPQELIDSEMRLLSGLVGFNPDTPAFDLDPNDN